MGVHAERQKLESPIPIIQFRHLDGLKLFSKFILLKMLHLECDFKIYQDKFIFI